MTNNEIIKSLEYCQSGIEKCNELKIFMEELNDKMNSIIDCYKLTKSETIIDKYRMK